MRARQLTVLVLAIACMLGLAACKSNVGVAARVNGHKISEADVAKFLVPGAQPLPAGTNPDGSPLTVSQRLATLDILIKIQIIEDAFAQTPSGRPTDSQVSDASNAWIASQNTNLAGIQDGISKNGFKRSFASQYAREQGLEQLISAAQQQPNGPDIVGIIGELAKHVSVNPRYGAWDAKNIGLKNAPAPSYLTDQPDYQAPLPNLTDVNAGTN